MSPIIDTSAVGRLLVPLDESHDSERALPVAIRLAERMGARVELLAVANSEQFQSLHEHLDDLVHQSGSPVEHGAVVEGDDVPLEIARRARSRTGSTIVMITDGPRRTSGLVSSSLASELLADGLPIVAIGPHAVSHASDLPIVACIDGSTESEQVLPVVASLAATLRVPVVLLVVSRPRLEQVPGGVQAAEEADDVDAADALKRAADIVGDGWPDLEVHASVAIYPWNIADAVSLYLERHEAQMFAAATHVRSGWRRLIAPSTTARLVRQLKAPILVVPIQEPEIEEPEIAEPVASGPEINGSSAQIHAVATTEGSGHRAFREVIVPIGPDEKWGDAVVVTASKLAAACDTTLTFVTCGGLDAHDSDARRAEFSQLLERPLTQWQVMDSKDVADAIVATASAAPESIVCLATHARGRTVDTLMPTTAGAIMRWSPRPVVLVGPACAPPADTYTAVIACVDGSLLSESVADLAGVWGHAFGLPVRIVEAFDPVTTIRGAPSLAGRYVDRLAARTARRHDVVVHGEAIEGADAAHAIRQMAESHPESLLVMASHGAGLSEHVLGGVVMDVVRHVPTPVVVVPAHAPSSDTTNELASGAG